MCGPTHFFRQLAQNQVGWFKRDPAFHWLNIAPGGERLALGEVAKSVKEWFLHDTPLPREWDGSCLQTLVRRNSVYTIMRRLHFSSLFSVRRGIPDSTRVLSKALQAQHFL